MRKKNAQLKEAIIKLSRDDGIELAELIRAIAKRRSSGLRDNTDLFFQVEPFAREFQEYSLDQPGDRNAVYGFTISNRIGLLKRDPPLLKYKAMFFGWLSYYHPNDARKFCKNIKLDIPFYKGHPDLSDCSDEAKDIFQKQDRDLTEVDPKPKTIEVVKDTDDQGVLSNIDDDKPALSQTNEPKRQFNKPAFFIVGSLILLALLSFGLWSSGFFTSQTDNGQSVVKANKRQSVDAETETANKEKQLQSSDANQEVADKVKKVSTTKKINTTVSPVWDEITQFAWSTKVLAYIYPYLSRSNRSDLLNAAKKGNGNAQTLYAIGMHSGRIGRVDHKKELDDFLLPACSNGHGRACALVAAHYSKGFGVPQNQTSALSYYKRSCKLGALYGCYYEAERYFTGIGAQKNISKAIKTYKETCELGVGRSCWRMAYAHVLGFGADKDMDLARQYYDRSRLLEKPLKTPFFEDEFESNLKS